MWIVGALAGSIPITVAALLFPTYALAAFCAALVGIFLIGRAHLVVPLMLVAAGTALPTQVPTAFSVGGFSFKLYELLLAASFVWAVSQSFKSGARRTSVFIALWGALGVGIAALNGAEPVRVIGDVRYLFEMSLAVVIAAVAVQMPGLVAICARALRFSLWTSASFVALASAGLVTLAGRAEAATLFETSDDVGTTRYLTAATFFALVVACACISLAVFGRATLGRTWSWFAPAIFLLFLAFSRNHLIGIAVTLVVAVFAARSYPAVRRAFAGAFVTIVAVGGIALSAPAIADLPGGGWASAQVQAYTSRVIDGLRSETLARDSSARYREQELVNLEEAYSEAPVLGHGFGYAYQPPQGEPGTFWFDRAPYYSHNFYWWSLVKTGIVGLFLVIIAFVGPLAAGLSRRYRDGYAPTAAACLAGLLAVSWVAPLPIDSPTSLVIGLVLGSLVGWTAKTRIGEGVEPSSQPPAGDTQRGDVISISRGLP